MKKTLIILLFAACHQLAWSQGYDTTTFYGKSGYIFDHVSTTQITTGLLRDFGIDFLNLDNYNGKVLNDTNWVTLPDFRALYGSLYSDQIKSPANMLGLDSINNLISQYALSNLPVTFVFLYYNYNVLDTNAVTENLMTVQNGQIYDVSTRTKSPYLLDSVFAIAPTQQTVAVGNNQFILRPQLFISNTGKTVSTLQIDPDGSGTYQTVSFGTPFNVYYDTVGLYTVKFKVTYSDGTINYSHTKLAAMDVHGVSMNINVARHRNMHDVNHFKGYGPPFVQSAFIFGTSPEAPQDFTADKAYLGVKAEGDYTIDYSIHNSSGHIHKPLIVIAGFDPDAKDDATGQTYLGYYRRNMDFDINFNNYKDHPIPLNGDNGLDNADSFDVVYLHWHNGTDYIQRNAYLLEKLIAIVNAAKQATANAEQNVIIGTSMGGLVARYALRDMEINSVAHDTRLFISDDAPNWGANVPPAYQALVQYLAPWQIINTNSHFPYIQLKWRDLFPDAVYGLDIFNSPAAQQMLIQRYILNDQSLSASNTMHTSFMNELNNMGWPVNCKNMVLSNGSCDGSTLFSDNSQMLSISGTHSGWTYFGNIWRSIVMSIGGASPMTYVIAPNVSVRKLSLIAQEPLSLISTSQALHFDFGAWAVPSSGTSLIFKGDVYMKRKLLGIINSKSYFLKCHVNSVSGMLPLDNAPGGVYDIGLFFNVGNVNSELHQQLGNWINATVPETRFCFVPTVSSLALSDPEQNFTEPLCDHIACLLPTGVSDYYAPEQSEIHVSYTTDNSNWILARQDAGFSCKLICPDLLSISGDPNVCTTANYLVSGLPTGANVAWSASPSGIVNITPNGNNAMVSRVSPGSFVLTATVINSCGQNGGVSKQIGGGLPTPIFLPHGPVCSGEMFTLSAVPDPSATSHHWVARVGGSDVTLSENGYWSVLVPANTLYVDLFITNPCGTADKKQLIRTSICQNSSTLNISPNPAMSNVTVTMQQPNTMESEYHKENLAQSNSENDLIRSLYIYDSKGTLKIKKKIGGEGVSRVQVDISSLVPGIYIVQTQNKQGVMQGKLIVQR